MLLQTEHPAEALDAYTLTLRISPGRLRALAGAQHAAEASGQHAAAREFATQLLDVAKEADAPRPELEEARRLLDGR
jgi:hypothetical protein